MRHALVNGISLQYDVAGAGEPVLMISPVIADGCRPLVAEPALAGRYQLISYHKRGWGQSTHTPPPVGIADHAADAAALLDHLGIRRAHIVGHSSGAAVAVQMALDHSGLVHTLSLLELSLLSVPSAAALLQAASPAFESYAAGDRETAFATFMSTVSGLDWPACCAALERHIPGAVPAAIEDAATMFEVELPALQAWTFGRQEAAAIAQPVLSLLGARTERLWIDVAERLRDWMPQTEERTIAGVGHLLHIQAPAPVAESIAAFLARHPMTTTAVGQGAPATAHEQTAASAC
jgi:pimeloyl-ACP methyl ester carboxylesterase